MNVPDMRLKIPAIVTDEPVALLAGTYLSLELGAGEEL